jgi:addiction module HigA family antidote
MSFSIQLLGRPVVDDGTGEPYGFRSRKSWALLAYLLLTDRPPSRRQLAALLFADADDPLRALRWSIGEIRHALGEVGSIEGDPVVLRLPPGASVDVTVVTKGAWSDAVLQPGLGSELLEGAARRLGVTRATLSRIRHGHSGVTADMAVRLSLLLGTSAELWLGMQSAYDLWNERQKPRPEVLPLAG